MLSKPGMDDQDERHKFLTHEQIFTKHIICAMPFFRISGNNSERKASYLITFLDCHTYK